MKTSDAPRLSAADLIEMDEITTYKCFGNEVIWLIAREALPFSHCS
jgi:hypothetical protein